MGDTAHAGPGAPGRGGLEVVIRPPVFPVAVREQLQRILTSDCFARSERPSRLLRFLVEETLAGRVDSLKEYSIGVEVLQRPPSFDPRVDPIVRAEVGRLRKRLEDYYENAGRADPILIEIPKRTYGPVFRRQQSPVPIAARVRSWISSARGRGTLIVAASAFLLGAVLFSGRSPLRWLLFWRSEPTRNELAAIRSHAEPISIAVLPFADLSAGKTLEYVGDGLAEELIEALAQVRSLRVVSRTSAFHFKGKLQDVREIGAQLGVRLVLEGSVRHEGDRLRVIAQLVSVDDGFHVWSGSYHRDMEDLLVIPEGIARAVATALKIELAGEEPLHPHALRNPEAYEEYMKGLHFKTRWGEEGLRAAVEHLEQSIQIDPDYAPAYAELANCYSQLSAHGSVPPMEVMPKAKAAAAKALEIDHTLGHVYAASGLVKALYDWDWEDAEQDFQRALQLDPRDASLHEARAVASLTPRGLFEEAFKEIQVARELDPVSPRIRSLQGMIHHFGGRYDEAMADYQEALYLAPGFSAAHLGVGLACAEKSMFKEAIAAFQKGRTTWSGGMAESLLAQTYARMGNRTDARKLLDELIQLSRKRYVSGAFIAGIYLSLGEKDRALEWLERAHEQRSHSLVFLKVNPRWNSLRSEPRFIALLKKLRLA